MTDAECLNNWIYNFLAWIITDKILKITVLCGKLNIHYAICLRNPGNILGS